MITSQLLLLFSLIWVAYAVVGYLALLAVVARFWRSPVARADITPTVSLLIAAHNEEAVIAQKLENSLALDYPAGCLEVIVMSDNSTDRTDEIVQGFAERGVRLHRITQGRGKPNAMNATVPHATGDIVIISDADSTYTTDCLRKIVRNFADPTVGAVTGEEVRLAAADGAGLGESLYCRLDNQIKRLEGAIGMSHMVNGGFAAIRRELYPFLDPSLNFDLVWPPYLRVKGLRTVYEKEARSYELYPLDAGDDFRRRIRTVLQAYYSYQSVPPALNPLRTGWFAWGIFSHRLARWLVPAWLAVAFLTNVMLVGQGWPYLLLLVCQLACYTCAVAGWALERRGRRFKPFYLPYYFLYIHVAALIAVLQGVSGRRVSSWTPTARQAVPEIEVA